MLFCSMKNNFNVNKNIIYWYTNATVHNEDGEGKKGKKEEKKMIDKRILISIDDKMNVLGLIFSWVDWAASVQCWSVRDKKLSRTRENGGRRTKRPLISGQFVENVSRWLYEYRQRWCMCVCVYMRVRTLFTPFTLDCYTPLILFVLSMIVVPQTEIFR